MCYKWKQVKRVRDLEIGQVVKNVGSGVSYMVINVYGDRATAVRTADITNASEWEVIENN